MTSGGLIAFRRTAFDSSGNRWRVLPPALLARALRRARVLLAFQVDEPAMFFPGDRFRYFLESTDTDGNTTRADLNYFVNKWVEGCPPD